MIGMDSIAFYFYVLVAVFRIIHQQHPLNLSYQRVRYWKCCFSLLILFIMVLLLICAQEIKFFVTRNRLEMLSSF